ncbi:unnamed protein product [Cyclocybe aegerita]|uniref:Uncharacterized protein n=1 Tax=Cyclocybe aegerita TaxID=1973307 RepID=A0A8S0VV07_CYCAE|nr:unnamed protein product [Cyclocybe aegerita]
MIPATVVQVIGIGLGALIAIFLLYGLLKLVLDCRLRRKRRKMFSMPRMRDTFELENGILKGHGPVETGRRPARDLFTTAEEGRRPSIDELTRSGLTARSSRFCVYCLAQPPPLTVVLINELRIMRPLMTHYSYRKAFI